MKRKYMVLCGVISIFVVGCSNSNELQLQNESFAAQIEILESEKESLSSYSESLSAELESEKKKANSLQQLIDDMKKETVVQASDVSVVVTDKRAEVGTYGQLYCPLIFDVTNNTDKDIQGVKGTLKINDLFDVEILSIGCDFTGQIIPVGQTVTIDNLSYDANQFINTDMKFYNTAYNDLKFEYVISQIVFADGSVKK